MAIGYIVFAPIWCYKRGKCKVEVGDFEEGIIPDFQKWILQLNSDNPNKRYEACEELRVAGSIPDEAISALHETTNDTNPDVADAAKRALAMHMVPENISAHPHNNQAQESSAEHQLGIDCILGLLIFTLITFVPLFLLAWWYTKLYPAGFRPLLDLLAPIGHWIGGQDAMLGCTGILIAELILIGLLTFYKRLGPDQDQK